MRILILLFVLLSSCGWKPLVGCDSDFKKESLKKNIDDCIEQPQLGIMRKF
jgi:hypothetical protein|tara:strand:- start:275 stop:427 length:153 start_codon:yes stop_codon:yes gene_type:complete